MSSARRHVLLTIIKCFDVFVCIGSFALATLPALHESGLPFAEFFSMRIKIQNFLLFTGLVLAWHLIFACVGLYESHRLLPRDPEILDALKAASLCAVLTGAFAFVFHVRMIDLRFVLVFWASCTLGTTSARTLLRYLLDHFHEKSLNLRQVLIVGTNARAVEFARKIESRRELGCRVIGFSDMPWRGNEGFNMSGYRLACDLQGIREFIRDNVVDEIVIALPIKSFYSHASRIAALCEEQGIVFRVLPGIFNLRTARSTAEELAGDSLLTLYTGPLDGWAVFAKRVLDMTLSAALLTLFAPAFLAVAVLVKLTSPGPIFFTQERLGLNKRRFKIFKFRTMVPDAEKRLADIESLNEVSGPVFKIADDPRLTSVGKLLRKTSLDEIPQLFNVLKGDMSLVGPRPLPVRDYEGFDQDWHRRRFSVRPGLTCLWQVSGRSSVSFDRWMQLDMQYIDKWSLWLDFKILADTIPAVLKGTGAA